DDGAHRRHADGMTCGVMAVRRRIGHHGLVPTPFVAISPAMAVPSRLYAPLVAAFESHGWDAVALPRRGFEKGLPVASREHDWGYVEEMADIADAVAKARADDPQRPVIVLGH